MDVSQPTQSIHPKATEIRTRDTTNPSTQMDGFITGWGFFSLLQFNYGFGKVSEYRFRNKLFIIISFFSLNSMRSLNEVKKNVE